MITLLTILHFIVCIFLGGVVLLQHGKGADVGATFGGGSQTVFGARGAATLLSKLTAWAAGIFMFTSVTLAYLHSQGTTKSLLSDEKPKPAAATAPVTPTGTITPSVTATATPVATESPNPATKK